jgi:cytochrome c peroxidase
MKNNSLLTLLVIIGISVALFACSRMEDSVKPQTVALDLPESPYDYASSSNGAIDFFNGVDNNIATLGRVLFYDKHLSLNNSVSCGSCHKQTLGFADNVKFSAGFQNHSTLRNTLPIQNLNNSGVITVFDNFFPSQPSLFWDGRASFLPNMVLMPITNHVEMGMGDMDQIVEKVKGLSYYNDLFTTAFGGENTVNSENIANALSQFVSSIFSGNTKFDKFRSGLTQLTALETEGRNLFFNKYDCNSCHQAEQLNGYELGGKFANIGLEEVYTDKGRENITNDPSDNGKVKIPSLRNIALTGPYMHDGRFNTLEEVLNHYSTGIASTPGLDQRLKNDSGNPLRMNISDHEKTAIIAFLHTMTDYSMITDPKFSNPFKVQ